jgi:predicted RNA binding protein YcfA (HicA-like mRNA interferase family)
MSSPKELNELIKQAEQQGWNVCRTNGNHMKWVSPLGGVVFTSSTPSDARAMKNIKRDLRVNGFIEITRKTKRKR